MLPVVTLVENHSHSLQDVAHPLTLVKVWLKLNLASREEGGQVTAPIRMQCHAKSSDDQSQHCASKSLYFKSSTKEGWSFTQPLNDVGGLLGGSVKL